MEPLENQPTTVLDWDDPNHPISPPKCSCENCAFFCGGTAVILACAINPKSHPVPCCHWELNPNAIPEESCKVSRLKTGEFRVEFRSMGDHLWSLRRFSTVEDAVHYAQDAISSYRFGEGAPDDGYVLEDAHPSNPVADQIYRDWLIYTQFVGESHIVDPTTNDLIILALPPELLQKEEVNFAKDFIDAVERDRFVPPGQLNLF